MNKYASADEIGLAAFMVLLSFLGAVIGGQIASDGPEPPRLVGYDCMGASGPLYANEEDDFPLCREITAVDGE